MDLKIVTKSNQIKGAFDKKRIQEIKPVAFPQENGPLSGFSSLFYWAHAWSDEGGLIEEHPHKGFEIITYVLSGKIDHYDTINKKWIPTEQGNLQIIRSGKGISHAERFHENTSAFQIWFDPDLSKSMGKNASYDSYSSDSFSVKIFQGRREKEIIGKNSLVVMDTPNLLVKDIDLSYKIHQLDISPESIYAVFIIKGTIQLHGKYVTEGDLAVISDCDELLLSPLEDSRVFYIRMPGNPGYKTFSKT